MAGIEPPSPSPALPVAGAWADDVNGGREEGSAPLERLLQCCFAKTVPFARATAAASGSSVSALDPPSREAFFFGGVASEPGSPATRQAVRAQNFDLLQGFKTGHTSVTADDDKGHPPQSAVKTQGAWTRQLARCHLTVTSRPASIDIDTKQHRPCFLGPVIAAQERQAC